MHNSLFIQFVIAILGQFLDGLLTYIGLGRGFKEGNPIGVYLFATFGLVPGILMMKAAGIGWVTFAYKAKSISALITINVITYIIAIIPWLYIILIVGNP